MAVVEQEPYWSEPVDKLLETLNATKAGLSTAEASARQQVYGINEIGAKKKTAPLALFLNQFKNPIIIILIIATLISALTGDVVDSLIILAIIVGSAVLSFYQEYSASNAVDELRAGVQSHATVLRDGSFAEVGRSRREVDVQFLGGGCGLHRLRAHGTRVSGGSLDG